MLAFDLQILLVRHLLLSLPWHRLDPEGEAEHGCFEILSTEDISAVVYKEDADVYS